MRCVYEIGSKPANKQYKGIDFPQATLYKSSDTSLLHILYSESALEILRREKDGFKR